MIIKYELSSLIILEVISINIKYEFKKIICERNFFNKSKKIHKNENIISEMKIMTLRVVRSNTSI